MRRTQDNIRDKYREMGEDNSEQIVEGLWSFAELVQFLKLLRKYSKVQFLNLGNFLWNLDIELELEKA